MPLSRLRALANTRGLSGCFLLLGSLLLILALAACGRNYYPALGDNDPHPGVRRAHSMPIHGIDVSRHQGDIDWNAVARAGVRFAFIKATDGGDYLDPRFRENWREARQAGIPRGAYHFIYWCRPADEQAAWFVQNVPAEYDALPPVLDLEWNSHSTTCNRKVSRQEALSMMNVILEAMERHTGKVPIIYTDINFYRDVLKGVRLDNPLWLRSTAAEPADVYDNSPFTFWQYTQTGTVPGIREEVDRNAFFGTQEQWVSFFMTSCDPRGYSYLVRQGRCEAFK